MVNVSMCFLPESKVSLGPTTPMPRWYAFSTKAPQADVTQISTCRYRDEIFLFHPGLQEIVQEQRFAIAPLFPVFLPAHFELKLWCRVFTIYEGIRRVRHWPGCANDGLIASRDWGES